MAGPRRWLGCLQQLSAIEGLDRLRYTTSHPRDMTDDLIEAHRDLPKLMPYLHLPFQSGADRVLAAMNRKHTAKDYLVLIERIRDVRPDIALSTDIIVGFPGETDAEFEASVSMVRHVGFAQAYSFKYSSRPGTPAASIEGQVPEGVRTERLARLQMALSEQHLELQPIMRGADLARAVRETGASTRANDRPVALSASRDSSGRRRRCLGKSSMWKSLTLDPAASRVS